MRESLCSNAGRSLLVAGARAFRRALGERRAKAERNSNRRGQRLFSVSQRVFGQGERDELEKTRNLGSAPNGILGGGAACRLRVLMYSV